MKNTPLTLGIVNLCVLLTLVAYLFFFNNQKLVYVDSAELINNYKGMLDARKVYQNKTAKRQANIDTLAREVQNQIAGYEKQLTAMTLKERQLSQELIQTKQAQLMEYQRAMNAQAQEENNKILNEVSIQVNAYLKKYGKSHGYKIIMGATQFGNLVYADESLDITEEVLIGLNKEYTGQ